jgi:hypothetical protein
MLWLVARIERKRNAITNEQPDLLIPGFRFASLRPGYKFFMAIVAG